MFLRFTDDGMFSEVRIKCMLQNIRAARRGLAPIANDVVVQILLSHILLGLCPSLAVARHVAHARARRFALSAVYPLWVFPTGHL